MTKTLSDVHGKRANRAAGAKPAEFAVDGDGLPVRKVPGELHSATFLHHVGIEANHGDETLSIAHRAFNSMSRVLG